MLERMVGPLTTAAQVSSHEVSIASTVPADPVDGPFDGNGSAHDGRLAPVRVPHDQSVLAVVVVVARA